MSAAVSESRLEKVFAEMRRGPDHLRPRWVQPGLISGPLGGLGGVLIAHGLLDRAWLLALVGLAVGVLGMVASQSVIGWWYTVGYRSAAYRAHGVCSWCHSEEHTRRRCPKRRAAR